MIDKIKGLIDIKLMKFIIIGIINTIVGTAIMLILYNYAGYSYWISTATNYILTSILSYVLNKYVTFQNKDKSWKTIFRFIINIAVCYGLAYGIAQPTVLWLLAGQSKRIKDNAAMFIGMCLFTGLNYLGQRLFTFKEDK